MANSKMTISFVSGNKSDKGVSFSMITSDNKEGVFKEVFQRGGRTAKGQIPILNDATPETLDYLTGNDAAQYYAYYLDLDYNKNKFTITVNNNVVTITSLRAGWNFISESIGVGLGSIVVTNGDEVPAASKPLVVTSYSYEAANTDTCNKFKLNLTTNEKFLSYQLNGVTIIPANGTKNLSIELLRDVYYTLALNSTVTKLSVNFPQAGKLRVPFLDEANYIRSISSDFNGGIISIRKTFFSVINEEYSIDNGATWTKTAYWSGLANGEYTILIRDVYANNLLGCQISVTETINLETENTRDKYISISKANSLYFAKQEDTDGITVFKNDTNSFSHTNKGTINYCNKALFEQKDETRIQLKTSYNELTVTLRSDDGNAYNIPVNQRTDNLERFRSMDVVMERYTDDKSIVYFLRGYNYDRQGNVINTYSSSGLPDFAIVGEKVRIQDYGVFEIEDIIRLDSIDKDCLVINTPYLGDRPDFFILSSIYNILDFNIYDFDIIWALYPEGIYDVLIEFGDTSFESVYYLSENIDIREVHENTVHIRAFNTNNRDIFYKYDIYPTIRVPIHTMTVLLEDEIDNNITDNSVQVVKSTINEGTNFVFDDMTREALVKISIFLSCEYVFIDGIGYAKSSSLEYEEIDNTNLQKMSARMLKTEINYNNLININTGIDFGYQEVDVPNFGIQNTNFIKL